VSLEIASLPTFNALLNALTTMLLLRGFYLIRHQRIAEHRRAMLGAVLGSTLFLASYLLYHFEVGSVKFQGTGAVRTLYLTILASHTVLAATVPFLVAITLTRALRERFDRHKAIARWTLPIWLYVSVTGVVVYLMLYGGRWV
jgi:putative membrane protein